VFVPDRENGFLMAQYEHLPIFRKSFELAVYLEKISD